MSVNVPGRGDALQFQDLEKKLALGFLAFLLLRMTNRTTPITMTASNTPTKPERMATMFEEACGGGRFEVLSMYGSGVGKEGSGSGFDSIPVGRGGVRDVGSSEERSSVLEKELGVTKNESRV